MKAVSRASVRAKREMAKDRPNRKSALWHLNCATNLNPKFIEAMKARMEKIKVGDALAAVDQQTVVFPGFDGGAEWGGSAGDPTTGLLYVNANDLAWTGGLAQADWPAVPCSWMWMVSSGKPAWP